MRRPEPLVVVSLLATFGCHRSGEQAADAGPVSTVSAPSHSTTAERPASKALAIPAPPAASGVLPAKIVINTCTFELEAPEALSPTAKDAMSVTYAGKHVEFVGYSEVSLGIAPSVVFAKPESTLFVDEQRDPALLITRNASAPKPIHAVSGIGAEKYLPERSNRPGGPLGCGFRCSGEAAFEGDVLAMCKSVRVTYGTKKQ